jgi:ribonuclease HI
MGTCRRCTRAELCTVLAAIGLWSQFGEGFKIVIACNSEYIMNRISKWILMWRKNEWWTNTGVAVENLDLWRKLDAKLKNYEMLVQFW